MSARRIIYPAPTPRTVLLVAAPQPSTVYTIRRPIAPADAKPQSLGKRKAPMEQQQLDQYVDILRDSDGESDCDSERSANAYSHDDVDIEEDLKLYEQKLAEERDGAPVRKRERLTHLSPEEKMWRRKMKNRIAAQTARDRKKARMDNIEDAVQKLERQNRNLTIENAQLRKQNAELLAKMNAFEQQYAQRASVDSEQNTPMNTMSSVESAARTGQQRDIGTLDQSTLHICDIDLQRIIDDLLRDAPVEQANTDSCVDTVGVASPTSAQSSSYSYTSIDGSASSSTSDTDDSAIIINLEELTHDHIDDTTNCIQIQDVPHTPPTPMLLLDADLIDINEKKCAQDNSNLNYLYGGSPIWNEDFSDLFDIVN